jgi:hypothetical protein
LIKSARPLRDQVPEELDAWNDALVEDRVNKLVLEKEKTENSFFCPDRIDGLFGRSDRIAFRRRVDCGSSSCFGHCPSDDIPWILFPGTGNI